VLKKRLVGCVIVRDGIVVQSLGFRRYLPVGRPEVTLEFLNQWGIDEIVLLDITAARRGGPDCAMVKRSTERCFVPLTVGGGVRTVADMDALMHSGADKIAVNTAAVDAPALISEGAARYGNQCIVVAIDARRTGPGRWEAAVDGGRRLTGVSPDTLAHDAVSRGAGEILITSIDRDGSKQGFDLELIDLVASAVDVPVIVCGGAGHPRHFLDAFRQPNVSAVAAANYFQFTEHSPIVTKAWLGANGFDVRLETYAHYRDSGFDADGRLQRRTDEYLDELIFEIIPPEVI
jgi:cyclase